VSLYPTQKIDYEIPPSQEAYRQQRSAFAYKLVIERTISARTRQTILLDMSKAFDRVDNKSLANDLCNTMANVLHIIAPLLNVKV